ncbi:MAG: NAD(P)-dependent oxidoreductase [Acidobacteria bacterium]|nr:NAD(P)-dependent oxidoreductase [Acidobacteriota bacterium]
MKAGLIGYGLLGSAIGERLRAGGFDVTAYDPAVPGLAPELEDAVREFTVLCLPDSSRTAAILPRLAGARVVIDATTGDPGEMAAFAGIHPGYVDAAIGGSSTHLRNGEAIVLAGGDVEAALPVLTVLGRRVIPCGPGGSGARMKLVFNLVLGLNRAALAEGLAFGEAQGFDTRLILDALTAGPAASRIMSTKGPKMAARDYTPEARLAQHHKDVRLMLAEGMRLPLTEAHERVLQAAEEMGLGASDNSALIEVYRRDIVSRR